LKLFQQRLQQGQAVSTEWIETTLRAALLQDGRCLLETLLAQIPVPEVQLQPGQRLYRERSCAVLSMLGPLTLCRDYYHPPGPEGGFPLDRALGLIGHCTPGAARMLGRTAAQLPYLESSQQLQALAGLTVDASQIQRLVQWLGPPAQARLVQLPGAAAQPGPQFYVSVDGTGVPMVEAELEDRAGRGPEGKAKTREVKLAALFTQTTTDEEGRPIRDPQSTTYLASFVGSDDFGVLVRQAAWARGLARAQTVIYLGDGAAWVWEIARTCFPQAVQILDYYHASEHVVSLAKAVYIGAGTANNWAIRWQSLLYDSELDVLLADVRAVTGATPAEPVQKELDYLERNRTRMDYRRYRQEGWFIGSGVVEAGCKRVIGQRLKQSGMFWTEPGATAVASLRCALLSAGGWEFLWNQPLLNAA
jgi:hypothetical protein